MQTCFYYWLIQPLRSEYDDSLKSTPLLTIQMRFPGFEEMSLGVFGDRTPTYARLSIPGLPSEQLPEELLPLLQATREHLLSTLRLTFHPDTRLWEHPIWMFAAEPAKHHFAISLTQQFATPKFDATRARSLFVSAFPVRDELRLLVDGGDTHIPLQYRYLSLYKLLELHFKTKGQWRERDLREFLATFVDRFHEAGVAATNLESHLTELRDKCAHIKTGRRLERIGVTHLNHKEAARVEAVMPLLMEMAMEILNIRGSGNLAVERREWLEWEE